MTIKYVRSSYSVRKNDGIIVLPDYCLKGLNNLSVPSESEIMTPTALQFYPIGTQLRKNDRLYRYAKAAATMTTGWGFLKVNSIIVAGKVGNSQHSGFEGAVYANLAAGATELVIADTAAYENEYEGARLVIGNDTYGFPEHRIIGNDASSGGLTTLYIAPPGLNFAITTADTSLGISLNPYKYTKSGLAIGCAWYSAVGLARFPIANAYYYWLQTAGFAGGTGATTWPGQTAYQREVYANTDGSLIGKTSTTYLYQRVGFLLSGSASDYGTTFLMLQLDQ